MNYNIELAEEINPDDKAILMKIRGDQWTIILKWIVSLLKEANQEGFIDMDSVIKERITLALTNQKKELESKNNEDLLVLAKKNEALQIQITTLTKQIDSMPSKSSIRDELSEEYELKKNKLREELDSKILTLTSQNTQLTNNITFSKQSNEQQLSKLQNDIENKYKDKLREIEDKHNKCMQEQLNKQTLQLTALNEQISKLQSDKNMLDLNNSNEVNKLRAELKEKELSIKEQAISIEKTYKDKYELELSKLQLDKHTSDLNNSNEIARLRSELKVREELHKDKIDTINQTYKDKYDTELNRMKEHIRTELRDEHNKQMKEQENSIEMKHNERINRLEREKNNEFKLCRDKLDNKIKHIEDLNLELIKINNEKNKIDSEKTRVEMATKYEIEALKAKIIGEDALRKKIANEIEEKAKNKYFEELNKQRDMQYKELTDDYNKRYSIQLNEKDKRIAELNLYNQKLNIALETYAELKHSLDIGLKPISKMFNGTNEEKGKMGENYVIDRLKKIDFKNFLSYSGDEAHAADIHFSIKNINVIIEVKNKKDVTKNDIDKFFADINRSIERGKLNAEANIIIDRTKYNKDTFVANCALFISIFNEETTFAGKFEDTEQIFHIELYKGIPICYLRLHEDTSLLPVIKMLMASVTFTEHVKDSYKIEEQLKALKTIYNQDNESLKRLKKAKSNADAISTACAAEILVHSTRMDNLQKYVSIDNYESNKDIDVKSKIVKSKNSMKGKNKKIDSKSDSDELSENIDDECNQNADDESDNPYRLIPSSKDINILIDNVVKLVIKKNGKLLLDRLSKQLESRLDKESMKLIESHYKSKDAMDLFFADVCNRTLSTVLDNKDTYNKLKDLDKLPSKTIATTNYTSDTHTSLKCIIEQHYKLIGLDKKIKADKFILDYVKTNGKKYEV